MIDNLNIESDKDVAIIGIGLRFPGESNTPTKFWDNLINSFDGIVKVPPERWSTTFSDHNVITSVNGGLLHLDEWKKFDPLFFGISPTDAASIDPQERMMLTVAYEALEDSRIPSHSLRGSNTGVFVGVSNTDYVRLQGSMSHLDSQPKVLCDYFTHSIIANRVSYCFDFRGPSMCIDTACSSSLYSVDLAVQHIQNGECDVALGCGINAILDPDTSVGYSRIGVVSDHCLSFDVNGKGFVRSEGCGVVVLKRLSQAEKDGNRIYGIIRGRSTNSDGHCNKNTMSTPSSKTQSDNIKLALKRSDVKASDIYYVEAHATGTIVGDPIEVSALASVFADNHTPENPLKIGSIKSNIGHLEAGAGIASLIKVSLMLKNRKLVPSIKITELNPKIPFKESNIQVVQQVEDLPNDRRLLFGVNSFGIGGANCHLIVENYTGTSHSFELNLEHSDSQYMIPFSGNSKESIDKYLNAIKEFQHINFRDFALHQSVSLSHHANRRVVIASNWDEFNEMKNVTSDKVSNRDSEKKSIFVFCGQGPQWSQMGMQLYHSEPSYKSIVDRLDSMLKEYTGYSLIEKLNEVSNQSNDIHTPIIAQPSLFLFQVGLVHLFKYWGVEPSIVIGHSFGDITAAYISGNISLQTAIKVVHFRSIYQNETIGTGKMLVVGMSFESYQSKFSNQFPTLEIACFNAKESIVITGSESDLNLLVKELKNNEIFSTFLRTPCSFHSTHQKSIKEKVLTSLNDIVSGKSSIPWYSTVSADLKSDGMNARYIYDNIRKPVYFSKTLEAIQRDLKDQIEDYIFIEIAPHPTLVTLITQTIPKAKVISPIQRNKDEVLLFKTALSALHCNGVHINFNKQFNNFEIKSQQWKDHTAELPRYQWDSELYWRETHLSKHRRLVGPSVSILGVQSYNGILSYDSDIDIKRKSFEYLKDHKVKNKPLFPGAGYVDAIVEAFKSHQKDIIINRLEFLNPFFLTEDDQPPKLQTTIEKISTNDYKVQFYNKYTEVHDTENNWFKSAHSRVSLATAPKKEMIDIDSFKKQCNITSYNQQEFYQLTTRVGLQYGPAFQHIRSILVGNKMTFATLVPKSSPTTPSNILNATLIDNCAHGLFGFLEERRQFIFKGIEDLRINFEAMQELQTNTPSELYLLTKVISFSNYECVGNCKLVLPNGQLLLEMRRFRVGSTERLKMRKIKFPENELYHSIFQSKESTLPSSNEIFPGKLIEYSLGYINSMKEESKCIVILYYILQSNIPDFNLEKAFSQSIEESFIQFKLLNNRSNHKLFSRIIEIFREQKEFLLKVEFTEENIEFFKSTTTSVRGTRLLLSGAKFISQTLLGVESNGEELFKDGSIIEIYTSPIMNYYLHQTSHIVCEGINSLLRKKEKRLIKILELGGGTGCLTNVLIPQLDDILQNQTDIEVQYTFTDVSPFFTTPMSEKYKNQYTFKSGLNMKFKIIDIEKDLIEQGLLEGSYDIVVMAYVIHIAADIKKSVSNINRVISPNGWLLFVEPNYKVPFMDICFGGFSQIWNFEDDIRDYFSMKPDQWMELFSKDNMYFNTRIIGNNDSDGNQLPLDFGHSLIVLSQKSPIKLLPTNQIEKLAIIINDNQIVPIESFERFTNQPISIIKSQEIEDSIDILETATQIIFLPSILQMTSQTYQPILYSYIQLLQQFTYRENQPNITVITKDSYTSNFLSIAISGISRTAFTDHQELRLTNINIDSDLDNEIIHTIIQLSNNFSALGEYEYFIKDKVVTIGRTTNIKNPLLQQSVVYENNIENLACRLNLGLEFKLFHRSQLLPNEMEIEVKAVGLNFKDYLYHLQMLPPALMIKGDVFHPPYGLESSGIVTRVGTDVKNFKVGDEVLGLIAHSVGSHATGRANSAILKPKEMSFTDGASFPVVYGTVYHSLMTICHLDPENETVLIHGATGGVGLAAMNILRWIKCKKVYATAGSTEKIEYLRKNYSDILIDVFDSNTTDFERHIKDQCDGVNVIINTLAINFMKANFESLAPWGRIADLSLSHIYNNDPLDLSNFKNDLSYSIVDFQYLADQRTSYTLDMMSKISDAINSKELELLPIQVFSAENSKEALKSMRERKHIGKIVIDCSTIKEKILKPLVESKKRSQVPRDSYKLNISNSIVVTGQQGISLELIQWLSKHTNDSDIIVLSKSTLKSRLRKIINSSKRIHFYQSDVSNKQQLESTFAKLKENHPPIETIFHLAAIYEALPINEMTLENIEKVHGPKVIGAINLHEITIEHKLPIKQFILFSSTSGMSGEASQYSYNSANMILDTLSIYRNQVLGLPSKSILWGPLLGEGQVADMKGIQDFFLSRGMESLELSKFLGGLEAVISQNTYSSVIVADITSPVSYDLHPMIRQGLESVVIGETGKKKGFDLSEDPYETITTSLSSLLSISKSKLNGDTQLKDFGVDSLMTMQIKTFIDSNFEKDLVNVNQIPSLTINQVVDKIKIWKDKKNNNNKQ